MKFVDLLDYVGSNARRFVSFSPNEIHILTLFEDLTVTLQYLLATILKTFPKFEFFNGLLCGMETLILNEIIRKP